ncbi:MAG: AbrB family transcriptional regulator [Oscillatoriales cyanobacterium RM1_1_9]|nr:AbrB family transcriptional regulator [Oscillatoriales cyanobacterium SM2_3_0]NJO46428.1 AbrB family transcriptional regulator [Oscillatoriales cyanobacterium RM2_1_1]NJO71529.1 AbrB family transcriptional regulator [Oscillatoriales cyanobacterium RM1_1_9]
MAKTATEIPSPSPLTGKALLQKVKALGNLPRRETAKLCGYYTATKEDEMRANMTEFYDALLAAKGISLDPGRSKDGRGREASFRACVHRNGSLVIGANYTQSMGLEPGDQFEIRLGHKHIHLIQVEGKADENFDEEE